MTRQESSNDPFDEWVSSGDPAAHETTFLAHRWIESTNVAALSHRPNGDIVYVNPATADLVGVQQRDLIGHPLTELFGEEWFTEHERQLQAASPQQCGFVGLLNIDGDAKRRFEIDSTVLFTSTGEPGLVYLLFSDVTELLDSQAELLESNAKLLESNRDLTDFAQVASHDLREPLRKITTFAGRLRSRSQDSLDRKSLDYLDRMEDAARRMSRLIEDILSFSNASNTTQVVANVDLDRVLDQVVSDLDVAISETGATIHRGELPAIEGDPTQLGQLFQNLIANALKFRKPDQAPQIWIDADVRGAQWVLTVRDDGIGFDPAHNEKIFAMFERLHGRSRYDGTGVGLAICRRIAERHGGAIVAVSEKGFGATFEISFPRTMSDLLAAA